MKFLKSVLATIVGLFIFHIIFSVIAFAIIIGVVGTIGAEKAAKIEEQSILHIKLNKPVVERGYDDPLSKLNLMGNTGFISLIEFKAALKKAKEDKDIEGIFLEAGGMPAGYAVLEEMQNALIDFKKSNKFVVAYGDMFSERDYYLAAVADEIYLNPEIGVWGFEFNGLVANKIYLKGTLEKLDIKPEIFKVGTFKSAVEIFDRTDMSDADRAQTSSYLNSLNDYYIKKTAEVTDLSFEYLKELSDSMRIRNANDAVKYKLVTKTIYYDELLSLFRKKLNLEEKEKINFLSLGKYTKSLQLDNDESNKIAVIVAQGDIVYGEGDFNNIGSDTYAKAIRKAREDDDIKAIVIRINSPGGSALASDIMWREIMEAKKVKPVIASMSDLAASGGYYLAMACDTIIAHPNTITGSIGIFGVWFNTSDFFKNKLGITFDAVQTGQHSNIFNTNHDLTDFERSIIQKSVEEGYETFTSKAAKGRDMHIDSLKKVASGRVWTGLQALELGLVDKLGSLEDAIDLAAKSANIGEKYQLNYYPKRKNPFEKLFSEFTESKKEEVLKQELGEIYPFLQEMKKVQSFKGIQARLPYSLNIE